jgi:hypothetical protein
MWVSMEPELYPTCSPWLPSPANVGGGGPLCMLARRLRSVESLAQDQRSAAALVHEAELSGLSCRG